MIERKCTKCGTWNNDEDYCKKCDAPLSPLAIDKEKERIKKEKEAQQVPSKLDVLSEKAKNSKYWIVRVAYRIVYGMALVAGLFGAFMAWMAALSNA
ncbi:hypothetical protein K6119_01270 [Paracrocinitomix mangrovi]|uniref:hypothetical protein n=1 Tax=Paracrocinitomix mangrovi TaxID=2862509 RepID=UPI001C8EEEF9|nr:hypothetical protein [Paracrocinitomix mangrovi]UKN02146.1 hypothetical protein K6119_01270 [Paracrocinitomix mangrovi]